MAQGTTDTFSASCEDICMDALAALGVAPPGGDATKVDGRILTYAKRRLDDLVKSIDADGKLLWRVVRLTTTTTASTATVTISPLAVDIDDPIRYTKSGATTGLPIRPMSRDEYMSLPDRTSTASIPTRYYAENALSGGRATITLYLYPTPSDSGDTVEYAAFLRSKDFNTTAVNPDFPSSWNNCLKSGLTALLASTFGQPMLVRQYQDAFEAEKEKLLGSDNEKQGLFLVAFGGAY